jgi:hypothetical protein
MVKAAKQSQTEFDKFDYALTELLKVRHSEIKAKLDAEKQAKKRKKARKSSASREANDRV